MSKRREKNKPQLTTFSKQLGQQETREKEKNDGLIKLGDYFYSLSGMTFAGAILTVLLDYKEEKLIILVSSAILMVILALMGWVFIKRGNIKK